MKAAASPTFVACAVLAILCYALALAAHLLPSSLPPALQRHASAFAAAGGIFLVVEVWLGLRQRRHAR